eukprot:4013764-Prymnesium_polylepis.1
MPAARISATSRGMPDHQQGVLAANEPTHTFHRTGLQAENTPDILDNRNKVGRQTNGQRIMGYGDMGVAIRNQPHVSARQAMETLVLTRQMDHADGITACPQQHRTHELITFEVDTAYYHKHPKLPEIIAQLRSEEKD